jgi:hypothetical protein
MCTPYFVEIRKLNISNFTVCLLDDDMNLLGLQGTPWALTLYVDYVYLAPIDRPEDIYLERVCTDVLYMRREPTQADYCKMGDVISTLSHFQHGQNQEALWEMGRAVSRTQFVPSFYLIA